MTIEPLQELGYFTEWGGKCWESLVRSGVQYMGRNGRLDGLKVLEIGTRYGKMALLFSLLGAEVVGIDLSGKALAVAQKNTVQWRQEHAADLGVGERATTFLVYDGNLDLFLDGSFDVVFTKSVLVVVPELEHFLAQITRKLRPGGRIVFIENARGNALVHRLRALRHHKWDYRQAHYFTGRDVKLVKSYFEVEQIRQTHLPPIYLLLGKKRA
jgi:SAM-dependent methyltransferase